MPDFPIVEKAIKSLLNIIIFLKPSDREAKARPQLQKLLAYPTIQPLLIQGNIPAPPGDISSELAQICKSLTALSKTVNSLQKGNPPSKPTYPSSCHTQQKGKDTSKPSPHTYSAIAVSRLPNPSLVVNPENFKLTAV